MKKLLTLFLLVFSFAWANGLKAQEDKPLYLIFNDIEVLLNNGGVEITNAMDLYVKPVEDHIQFGKYVIDLPFNDQTLANYEITDFDAVIFPMGDKSLDYSTAGGVRVMDLIKDLQEAGKGVVIIGRELLSQMTSPDVRAFFEDELGIEYMGTVPVSHQTGSTIHFDGFTMIGPINDTITGGLRKICNQIYTHNNVTNEAWVYRREIEAFRIKEGAISLPIDTKTVSYGDEYDQRLKMTDTILGLRARTDNNKIVMWSVTFDVTCQKLYMGYHLQSAIQWFSEDFLWPEQKLVFSKNRIDFGATNLDFPATRAVDIVNMGRKPLHIDKIYIDDFSEDPEYFTIAKGGGDEDIMLVPEQRHTVEILFAPDEERDFSSYLTVESDADNGKMISIDLLGRGGKDVEHGPVIAALDTIVDYGRLTQGELTFKNIVLKNMGSAPLLIDIIEFVENDDEAFSAEVGEFDTPFYIQPEDTHHVTIRFLPVVKGKTYNAKVRFHSNGKNEKNYYVDLTAYCLNDGEGPILDVPVTKIEFEKTEMNQKALYDLAITNVGASDLVIEDVKITGKDKEYFTVITGDKTPVTVEPDGEHAMKIQFAPMGDYDKLFEADLEIESNSDEGYYTVIDLEGEGDYVESVRDEATTADGTLKLRAVPNPLSDRAEIKIELAGDSPRRLVANLVDASGKLIRPVFNSTIEPGTRTLNFDAANLPSGKYFIVADVGGSIARLPLIISK